jgi:hypothetical protein
MKGSTKVGSCLASKYLIKVKVIESDKRTSLLCAESITAIKRFIVHALGHDGFLFLRDFAANIFYCGNLCQGMVS